MEKITAASGMEESGDCAMDTTGAARHAADASVAVEEPSQHIPPTVFAANPVVGMNEQKTAPGLGNTQHWDSRPACPTGNMLMNNARGKKSHYSEVSACGDTGHLQQYLSAEDRQTDRGNTTVQWLLQQVTQLNDRLADTPDLRQLLGCLMLLSEVQGRLHDSSQPVDPLLIQQAQTSDMDCLLKSILGLGYDVVCSTRVKIMAHQTVKWIQQETHTVKI
nr:hypothetical protein BaRGS_005728 [Batillaria attramentaria]